MPRGKFQRRGDHIPAPPPLQQLPSSVRQQCCVICYKNFTPFEFNSEVWDSNMIKNFYLSLDIANSLGGGSEGGEDEDEEVLSLPFCPQCHTKVSVMAAYQIELQNIKSKCNSIRNDIAFTVVETIGQNSRDGPLDYIRQQIYDKWKLTYENEKGKATPDNKRGLEYVACQPTAAPHNCGNFVCFCHSDGNEQDLAKIGVNGPANGFEFDEMDFAEPVTKKIGKTGPFGQAPWRKTSTIPKLKPGLGSPPLLSPQLQKQPVAAARGFKSKLGSRTSSIPVAHQKRMSVPTVAQAQRAFGAGRSIMTPNTAKKKADYSHVKPRVPTRFLTPARKTMAAISTQNQTLTFPGLEGTEVEDEVGFESEDALASGKRKVGDEEDEGGPAKLFKESQSEEETTDGKNEAGSPNRPTRNSGRSPIKFLADTYVGEDLLGPFSCSLCPKSYDQRSRLLRHESDMHPECKEFQCDVNHCGKGFSSREAFKRHVHNVHKIPYVAMANLHTCELLECGKSFLAATSLEKHITHAHRGEPPAPVVAQVEEPDHEQKVEGGMDDHVNPILAVDTEVDDTLAIPIATAEVAGDEQPTNDLTMSTSVFEYKPKKKSTAQRQFGGGRRRKRGPVKGAPKKIVEGTEPPTPAKKKPRKPIEHLEPVRKSSRHRGVLLDTEPVLESQKGEDDKKPEEIPIPVVVPETGEKSEEVEPLKVESKDQILKDQPSVSSGGSEDKVGPNLASVLDFTTTNQIEDVAGTETKADIRAEQSSEPEPSLDVTYVVDETEGSTN